MLWLNHINDSLIKETEKKDFMPLLESCLSSMIVDDQLSYLDICHPVHGLPTSWQTPMKTPSQP